MDKEIGDWRDVVSEHAIQEISKLAERRSSGAVIKPIKKHPRLFIPRPYDENDEVKHIHHSKWAKTRIECYLDDLLNRIAISKKGASVIKQGAVDRLATIPNPQKSKPKIAQINTEYLRWVDKFGMLFAMIGLLINDKTREPASGPSRFSLLEVD